MANCCVGTYNFCINQYATYTKIFTWLSALCGCGTVGSQPQPMILRAIQRICSFAQTHYRQPFSICERQYVLRGNRWHDYADDSGKRNRALYVVASGLRLILTDSSGNVTRLLEGKVTVSPGVTP